MQLFTCPVCGGKLHIVIESGLAVCEACQRTFDADPENVQKYGGIVRDAERLMRQNTVAGYENAIRLFASVPFVSGTKEKQAECEKQLSELQERTERHRVLLHREDEKNTKLGIIILILTLLFAAAALGGMIYLVVRFAQGTLSKGAVITIASVVLAAVIVSVLGRLFAGRGSDS